MARAARAAGIGYVLSTFSGYRVEEVAAAAGPLWYQLYLAGGRGVVEASLARAWAAGCRVLAVTIDTNAPGLRERDIRNGSAQLIGRGLVNKLPFVPHLLRHPRWLAGYLVRSQGGHVLSERRHPGTRPAARPRRARQPVDRRAGLGGPVAGSARPGPARS